MNLTAITEPQAVAQLHFLDCLALLNAAEFDGKTLIDVGCGAGFPGVPLAIAAPGCQVTLLDSLGKRTQWLSGLLPKLGIQAEVVTARAEEAIPARREQYDIATARAVARLPMLCELCLPFVKVGGVFAALKGPDGPAEVEAAKKAISLLGGKVEAVKSFTLPGQQARTVVVIRKVQPTPAKYPRHGGKIAKQPL